MWAYVDSLTPRFLQQDIEKNLLKNDDSSTSKAVPLHAMEALGGEEVYSYYSFTTSALDGE
jgi:hypothetical protein